MGFSYAFHICPFFLFSLLKVKGSSLPQVEHQSSHDRLLTKLLFVKVHTKDVLGSLIKFWSVSSFSSVYSLGWQQRHSNSGHAKWPHWHAWKCVSPLLLRGLCYSVLWERMKSYWLQEMAPWHEVLWLSRDRCDLIAGSSSCIHFFMWS